MDETTPSPPADGANHSGKSVRLLVGLAAAVIVLYGMRSMSSFLGPAFLALVLTIAVSPLRAALQRRGVPVWLCVAIPLTTVLAGLLLLAFSLAISAAQLATVLPHYTGDFNRLVADVTHELERYGIDQPKLQLALNKFDPAQVFSFVQGFVSSLLSVTSALLLIVIMLFGMSLDAVGHTRWLAVLEPHRPELVAALRGFAHDTCRYLIVSTIFGLIVAACDTGALYLFHVPLPLLWGLLSFLTNYIPNIGFIVGLVPPALLTLLDGGWVKAVWVVAAYCVLNFVWQSLIQPKFTGKAVGLGVTMTTLSLFLWAWALGPLGALLAIPLSSLVKAILIDADPSKRWLSGPLSGGSPPGS